MEGSKNLNRQFFNAAKIKILEDEVKINRNTRDLLTYYEEAVTETENRIRAIYSKFAKENKISIYEARALLDTGEERVFRKSLAEYMKEISEEGAESKTKKELDILSASARLSREERLLASIYMDMGRMADKTGKGLKEVLSDTLKTNFVRASFNFQNILGAYYKIDMLSDAAIGLLLKHKWAKKNYSAALWGHVDNFNALVKGVLTDGFIQGKSIDKMVRSLKEKTDVCRIAVDRLIRTEVKYFANQGELLGFKANGVTKYVYLGAREKGFACNCSSLNGVVMDVEDAKPLVNFPPLHPNCKCSIRAYFEDSILDNNKDLVHYDKKLSLDEWKHDYIIKNEKDLVRGLKEVLDCDIIKLNKPHGLVNIELADKAGYYINDKGRIILSLFDKDGRVTKEFHNSNHGMPKTHDLGEFGEHVHDWDYEAYEKELAEYKKTKNGYKPRPSRSGRECTEEEFKIMRKIL